MDVSFIYRWRGGWMAGWMTEMDKWQSGCVDA